MKPIPVMTDPLDFTTFSTLSDIIEKFGIEHLALMVTNLKSAALCCDVSDTIDETDISKHHYISALSHLELAAQQFNLAKVHLPKDIDDIYWQSIEKK